MYSLAAQYFEPKETIAIDIDADALEIARGNIEGFELEEQIKVINSDLVELFENPSCEYKEYFDTVVMNPPFGTKNNEGIDMKLLACCIKAVKPGGVVYSLHKESTSKFIVKHVETNHSDCEIQLLSKIQFT